MRYAVIVGATGLVGSRLAALLAAERPAVPVRALLRRPAPDLPAGIEQVVLDRLDSAEELAPHIPPGSWVFCCIGTTMAQAGSQEDFLAVDLDIPAALAQAARAAGAEGFSVISSAGASARGFFFYTRAKGEMELAVQAAGLPAVHIFRPGLLLGYRKEKRLGERFAVALDFLLRPLMIGPLARYGSIEGNVLADKMLRAARQGVQGVRLFEGKELKG